MRVLHVIHPDRKFVRGTVSFISTYFPKNEHDILYLNDRGPSMIDSGIENKQLEISIRSKLDWKSMRKIFRIMKKYDFLICHSLFWHLLMKVMFVINKKALRKAIWVGFGGDLYPAVDETKVDRIHVRLNKHIATHIFAFVGIFPLDCEYFKNRFPNSRARLYYAPYCATKIPEEYKHYSSYSRLEETLQKKESIYILIGHSAVKEMGHFEVLDYLKRFSSRDIKLVIPLSYGNMEYANAVQEYAEKNFGKKIICLRDFMEEEMYFDTLKRIDIAIFNTKRQLGLGSVWRMIFRNVKTYMPEDSVMYRYYRSEFVPINKISDLATASFEELISASEYEDRDKCERFIKTFGDIEFFTVPWEKFYTDLRRFALNGTK